MTESNPGLVTPDPRHKQLRQWLDSLRPEIACDVSSLAPASSDASFRRYFRVATESGQTLIVMDAPPDHEDCEPFVNIARLFGQAGLLTPEIHAADLSTGFLLLSDLGNQTLLAELQASPADASHWYRLAGQHLVQLQQATRAGQLATYDRDVLMREIALFDQWYLGTHLNYLLTDQDKKVLHNAYEAIVTNNLAQATVYVHRDYHSRNLMVQPAGDQLGVIDFQDALVGPITYDLVSLLRDAYITWPEEVVLDWAIRYWEQAREHKLPVPEDFGQFWRDFEFMGMQRHLKVLGIFARLNHRDGKSTYLNDMPAVLQYTLQAMRRYSPLGGITALIERAHEHASHSKPATPAG